MRKRRTNQFHAQHYNLVAKVIRETYEKLTVPDDRMLLPETIKLRVAQAQPLYDLMLNFAVRFKTDNERFDAVKFLDQCSPDPDRFPFSELWDPTTDSIS